MDLDAIRQAITDGTVGVFVTQHARVEAFKEGFTVSDIRDAIMAGRVVEEYPGRNRVLLLFTTSETQLPMHVVLEYTPGDLWAAVSTVYLPDDRLWYPGYRRRR